MRVSFEALLFFLLLLVTVKALPKGGGGGKGTGAVVKGGAKVLAKEGANDVVQNGEEGWVAKSWRKLKDKAQGH